MPLTKIFNLMYFVVPAVGIIGAMIARFRPRGMARVLLATALAQVLVAVIALIINKPQFTSAEASLDVFRVLAQGYFSQPIIGRGDRHPVPRRRIGSG